MFRPESFHEILHHFARSTRVPLVFVFSERSHDSRAMGKLFPKQLQENLRFTEIKFNVISKTALLKAIRRIADAERRDLAQSDIDQLAEASSGDVRCAVNSLEMLCKKGVAKLPAGAAPRKRKRPSQSKSGKVLPKGPASAMGAGSGIGVRHLSLDLFHSVGKILSAKRGIEDSDGSMMPKWQAQHARLPTAAKQTPEAVLEAASIPPDILTLFLHENYLTHFASLEDAVAATEHFSDADLLAGRWQTREKLQETAASVCCRGLIHAKTQASPGGWKPSYKPRVLGVTREAAKNSADYRRSFLGETELDTTESLNPSDLLATERLYTELLPGLARIKGDRAAMSWDQKRALRSLVTFNGCSSAYDSAYRFSEKDSGDAVSGVLDDAAAAATTAAGASFAASSTAARSSGSFAVPAVPKWARSTSSASVGPLPTPANVALQATAAAEEVEEWDSD